MDDSPSTQTARKLVEKFDSLPLERRIEIFEQLSPAAREELIETVSRPGEVIRRLSEEEVFFTVKALGEEKASALIRLTTGKQLRYILDIDLWKKTMFNTDAAGKWFNILNELGDEKMLQFLQTSDPELLVTCLNRHIRVAIRDDNVDLLEQYDNLPSFTFDDIFFVRFRDKNLEDALKHLLQTMFEWNTEFYFGIMEELARGLSTENEEYAIKWRNARLADRGFPEFDEALEIYQYLQRDKISKDRTEQGDWTDDAQPFIGYPLKVIESDSLFHRSLDEITNRLEKDRLAGELAHLANKVMVADGRDPGSFEDLQGSLKKVGGYINIALEELSGENLTAALGILRSNHMEFLFRRGFSLILDLRRDAQKLLRNYEGGVENLGSPLAGMVQGLLQHRPVYADTVVGREKREFERLDDITRIRELIGQAGSEAQWEPI
jgi:hypothetical protein